MKLFKRIAILAVAALVSCTSVVAVSATETGEVPTVEYIEQLVENYANTWAEVMYSNQVVPQDIIKVVNTSGEITAYQVSFFDISTSDPMGYVVLSTNLSLENPVIEFALDGDDLYTQQQLDNPVTLSLDSSVEETSTQDKILISDDMLLYTNAEAESTVEYSLPSYPQPTYDLPSITGGLVNNIVEAETASDYVQGSSGLYFYRGVDFDNSGVNCAPTALTNLIIYYESLSSISGLIDNNPTWTYSRICSLAGFDGTMGLSNDEMLAALEEYVNDKGFNISIDSYWLNQWSDFTRDINNDKPILVSIEGWNSNTESWAAHAVVAFGYVETTSSKFLKVADGNYSSQRYLNFEYYGVHDGFCVYIY